MSELRPIAVEYPLRGEWVAVNTPGHRIPSHGTNQLGQRYAYDFLRIERGPKGFKFFRGSTLRYAVLGVKLDDCYGWSESIHAPFGGTVATAKDGWPERQRVHFIRDLALVLKNAFTFNPAKTGDLRPVVGNHIIVKARDREIYALLAHARCGSVHVREGQEISSGQHIADVGHSGNSTAPHLHFHLMDRADMLEAQGIPCCFQEYDVFREGAWERVIDGIPRRRQFIRQAVQPALAADAPQAARR